MCCPDEEDQLLVKLREGADLWVVLENRFGEKKYVESYHLSCLVLRGDFFMVVFAMYMGLIGISNCLILIWMTGFLAKLAFPMDIQIFPEP